MAKAKTKFVCSDCGADYGRWVGQCTECKSWNTVTEFKEAKVSTQKVISKHSAGYAGADGEVECLANIKHDEQLRAATGSTELDRVLGGGIVEGSVVLVSGEPGAGKSTLLIKVLAELSKKGKALVNSGEENKKQISDRAKRLGLNVNNIEIMTNGDVENMCQYAVSKGVKYLLVDSIQTMFMPDITSAPGGTTQVKESAAFINRTAKEHGITVLVVVHATKDGQTAGPQTLSHVGDATLHLSRENDSKYRTLRARKNRFGSAEEIGTLAMTEKGLLDISNPSAIFLEHSHVESSGNAVFASSEGRRTLLLNVQSLVSSKAGEYPQRGVLGVDKNRLNMLLAVMRTRMGVKIADNDIFLNVVGGIKVTETGADVPLVLAMLSSQSDKVMDGKMISVGEIGLSGEIRPVSDIEERVKEAARNGFEKIVIPFRNYSKNFEKYGAQIIPIKSVTELKDLVA